MGRSLLDFSDLPVFGAIFASISTFVVWSLLGTFLWFPYWSTLRDHGMHTHELGFGLLVIFGPMIVGAVFYVATVISLILFRSPVPRAMSAALTIAMLSIPGGWLILSNLMASESGWSYPLAEVTTLLIGGAWAYFLVRHERARGLM